MGSTLMGQTGRTSSHTHHGHKGLLHVLMGTVHAHIGKCVHKHSYSYLQGRVSTFIYWAYRHMHSCSGHFTCIWDYLGTSRHCTHTGPLVLGPQMGPKLTCICSEAVGNPYLWIVSSLFALPTEATPCFPYMPCNTACS